MPRESFAPNDKEEKINIDMVKKKFNITNFMIRAFGLVVIAGGIIMIMRHHTKIEDGYIGEQQVSITDGKMTPETMLALGRVSDPQLSPDGNWVMYGVTYTSVKDNRTCRNLFAVRTDGSGRQQLTSEAKSLNNARWIDGGSRIAYTQGGQIYVQDIKFRKNGKARLSGKHQLTNVPSGISEFTFSPDGSMLMYVSTVKCPTTDSPSDIYPDLDKADAISTGDLMYRHWDHWVKEIPHTFVAKVAKGKMITPENSTDILGTEPYELPAEPFSGIEQLSWSPDSRFIAYSCRKLTGKKYAFSTDTEIYLYRVSDGRTSVIDMKGGYDTDPVWSPDGKRICWVSMERDGYEADKQRLMLADISIDGEGMAEAGNIRDITAGFKYNVTAPVWSPDSKEIYFSALAEGLQGIFKAECTGQHEADGQCSGHKEAECTAGKSAPASILRITGEDQWYDFGSPFGIIGEGAGRKLLATVCSMNFPTELAVISEAAVETGTAKMDAAGTAKPKAEGWDFLTDENGHILSQIAEPKTEARYVKTVDGKDMLTWVLYPSDFDESKVYPSILICLGGPQGTLSQGWSYRWNYRLMADQGYVVVLPNRRGTTAFGQEWTEQISGDYSGLNIQDYMSAARELKAEPYIGKMAACGASYGGYSVYYLCGVHGDLFDAFIAHAGIFNEEHMYMTTEEMWFANWDNGGLHTTEIDPRVGTAEAPVGPKGDGETFGGIRQGGSPWSSAPKAVRHYANSPHKLVTKWHTPLLVIHGGMDFRVPVDEGMAAYNAAQLMGVPSKLLVFPDENHWILKPQNALFWHREYFKWLDTWVR